MHLMHQPWHLIILLHSSRINSPNDWFGPINKVHLIIHVSINTTPLKTTLSSRLSFTSNKICLYQIQSWAIHKRWRTFSNKLHYQQQLPLENWTLLSIVASQKMMNVKTSCWKEVQSFFHLHTYPHITVFHKARSYGSTTKRIQAPWEMKTNLQ
jgi:hypothetical protein